MTITIPIWVLWGLKIVASLVLLFLSVLGVLFLIAMGGIGKSWR